MRKILCLTTMPTPFAVEIFEKVSTILNYELILVFKEKNIRGRESWLSKHKGYFLENNKEVHFTNLLIEIKPDIVFVSFVRSKITSLAKKWCLSNKVAFYLGPHERLTPYNVSKPNSFYRNTVLSSLILSIKFFLYKRMAKGVNGIATIGYDALSAVGKYYKGPVINIPYTFSMDHLIRHQRPSTGEITFLFSGRLSWYRNPLQCIDVFADLVENNKNKKLKLIISGKGDLENECRLLIKTRNIEDKVEWIVDFKDWYDIHSIYEKAHVVLILQHYSNWGLITQEAMASGMGIIGAGEVGSLNDFIISHYNGYITNLSQPNILKAMQSYVDDPNLIDIHGKRNREIIANTLNIDLLANRFAKFILQTS